jgi:hypothetical protein
MDWIQTIQNMIQWFAFVKTVLDNQVPPKMKISWPKSDYELIKDSAACN